MRSLIFFLVATSTLAAADPFQSHIRPTQPLAPQEQQKTFSLPPGFEIQLFAAEPDIQKPLNMAFDTRGRLWVTGTVEYPYPAKDGEGRDAIRILADTTGDGRADKITTFVDGLNIPMGLYPYKNGVVAYNMPNIWYFTDTDGDDRADERHILYGPLGMPHDTHGMQNAFRRGYDGWLYICHGFANTSTIRGRDGSEVTMHSGNTYRVRLDGSRVEQVTWGQVNPFGMTFLPDGDIITADCHSKPLTLLLPGGHYSSFGKPHDGLGFAPNLMEHSHGSTAISGVAVISGRSFPADMNGDLLVGNVVTCRVHRDKLVYHGSTPKAIEQPDFITTTDPWFRPVDLQFGPDGALYIADFYNRIIGHYEVPLDHPQRDRHRGRIWRVVYRGSADAAKRTAPTAMDMLTDDVLGAGLDDNNLTRRMLITDRLSDHEHMAAPRLRRDVQSADTLGIWPAIHALWVLQRTGRLSIVDVHSLASAPDPTARVHALQAAGEMSTWGQPLRSLVLRKLSDRDAHVRRAAVQAVAKHPHVNSLRPLTKTLRTTDPDDQLLVHALRIALRNHLRDEPLFRGFLDSQPTPDERDKLASIALAVPSATAGEFLASTLAAEAAIPPSQMPAAIRHAVRYAPVTETQRVLEIARRRTANDIDLQLELVQAIAEGYRKRDAIPADEVRHWADELVAKVVSTPLNSHWTVVGSDIWGLEPRKLADVDTTVPFLSSLPGGEQHTGILRSRRFELPARFSFYLCGHRGFPDKRALDGNVVRLRIAKTGEVIRSVFPPRNDIAQQVTWEFDEHAGKQARLEIVDGLDLSAYAWLAVAQFDPPLLSVPRQALDEQARRFSAALSLASRFHLTQFTDDARKTLLDEASSWPLRAAAASSFVTLSVSSKDSNAIWTSLASLVGQETLPTTLRLEICQCIAAKDTLEVTSLAERVMKTSSAHGQRLFADQLLNSADGAGLLFELIEKGQASARLLRYETVRDRLSAAQIPDLTTRLEAVMASAPNEKDLSRLRDTIADGLRAGKGNVDQGQQVFTKHCGTCHQVAGHGPLIGPQLDGIGDRGLERVIEDVLDPNRNVDQLFRTVLLALADGRIISGLERREDESSVILVDKEAQERTVAVRDIEERQQSSTSLMPSDFDAVLKPEELTALVSYLLSLAN